MIRQSTNYSITIGWLGSLQKVLWVVAPIFAVFAMLSIYLVFHYAKFEVAESLESRLLLGTRAAEQVAREKFQITRDELLFFSRLSANRGMARALRGGGVDPTTDVILEDWIRNFNDVAFQYAESKSRILQIRIILANEQGNELLKLKRPPQGKLSRVPQRELQEKGSYSYMPAVRALTLDQVYWSPIELNVENGRIERPPQPTIRGATPIADDQGDVWAYLVINYDALVLLADLTRTFNRDEHTELFAYRPNGHYILHPQSGRAFQHELQPAQALTYRQEFELSDADWSDSSNLMQAKRRSDGSEFVALHSNAAPYEALTGDVRGRFTIHVPRERFDDMVWNTALPMMLEMMSIGLLFTVVLTLVMVRVARQKDLAQALGLRGSWQQAESEAMIVLMLEKLPLAMAMFDTSMRYLAVSERWCQEYGVQAQELIGRDHEALFPHVRNTFKNLCRQGLDGKSSEVSEHLIDSAGHAYTVVWRIEPWHRLDGEVAGIMVLSYRLDAS